MPSFVWSFQSCSVEGDTKEFWQLTFALQELFCILDLKIFVCS